MSLRPGRLSSPASAMPIGFCTSMCTTKKIRLFLAAFQNGFDQSASVSSVTKLARPTKVIGAACVRRVGREAHRRDQRVDREERVDRDRGPEKQRQARGIGPAASKRRLGKPVRPSVVSGCGAVDPLIAVPIATRAPSGTRTLPLSKARRAGRGDGRDERLQRPLTCAGLYHLSRPSCSCLPAASGVSAPLITCAETFQSSFSRFGVPRDRIWYELRIVDLQSLRQPTIVAARSGP